MRIKLKLARKALLLVLVPLLCETIFLLAMAVLLQSAEEQALRAEHSRQIVSQAHSLITSVSDAGTALYTANLLHKPIENYDNLIAQIPAKQAELEALVGNDEYEIEYLRRINYQIKIGVALMQETREMVVSHGEMHGYWRLAKLPKRFQDCVTSMISSVESIVAYEKSKQTITPEEIVRKRAFIKQCLLAGVGLNVILALWLTVAVSRGLTRRIEILTENTIRMSSGIALLPPQLGDDEINRLDAFFHTMADTMREVAEREKAAEEILRANEAKIRSVIDNILIGLVIADSYGTIDSVNPTAERMFQYSQDQICRLKIVDLFQQADSGEDVLVSSLKIGQTMELAAKRSNGELFPVESTVSRFLTADGERILLSMLDITERKEIERLRKDLVAVVSHDLRSPLSSVMAFLQVLIRGSFGQLNERGLTLAGRAEDELRRLMKLIVDLLDLARMDARQIQVSLSDINLAKVIERSIMALEGLAANSQIEIHWQKTDVFVTGDEERLIQVMINLLSNAIKFSPSGGTIKIWLTADSQMAEVNISDQGVGVPPELREKIFEQFEQGSAKSRQADKGVGLGLAICKSIIEAHKGTIGVRSATDNGSGSCFWLRLPLSADNTNIKSAQAHA